MAELTRAQASAVAHRGSTVLVSAAAGSGKTRVLIERVLRRVAEEGCDVDQFLMITFTEAAASELRGKLIGFIFREETSPTTGKTSVVARYPKDVETIRSGNYTVPEPATRQYYGPASELPPLEDEDIPF